MEDRREMVGVSSVCRAVKEKRGVMNRLSLVLSLTSCFVAFSAYAQNTEQWTCTDGRYLLKFSSDGKAFRLVSSSDDPFFEGYDVDDTRQGWQIVKDAKQGLIAVRTVIVSDASKSKSSASENFVSLDAMLLDKKTGDLVRVMGAVAEKYDSYGGETKDPLITRMKCLK